MKQLLFSIILSSVFWSCSENENFSSNPNLKLEFSVDAVRFDTVFTTVPSPMQYFKVYNRNNNSISIESIELLNGADSDFRINVNGQSGIKIENEDLLKKDSLYIRVDVKSEVVLNEQPAIADKIRIKWNGNTHEIALEAVGVNVMIWENQTIRVNTTLTAENGYYIKGPVVVEEGVTLSIEPGTTLYFDKAGSLTINGTLQAQGTVDEPIVFRGHRFDYVERGILYDNVSDQWQGITFAANSFNNVIENARIRNAKYGLNFLPSSPDKRKATIANTVIHNMSNYGLKAENCYIEVINSQLSNAKESLVDLRGGRYVFLHCTIANYYGWHARVGASVTLEDLKDSATPLQAVFANSIIVGTFREELNLFYNRETTACQFLDCLIQAYAPIEGKEFGKIIWNIDSAFLFKLLNQDGSFLYSFGLIENSSALDVANTEYSNLAPFDLCGISRLADAKPDIGCYEYKGAE